MSGVQSTEVGNNAVARLPLGLRLMCVLLDGVNGLARKKDGTFNRRLMNLVEIKRPPNEKPNQGVYTKDIVVDTQTKVWVRLFVPVAEPSIQASPSTEDKLPIVFFFHGGGFAVLSADFMLYDIFCRRVARRRRVIVISVDYRLAPEYRYPTPYEDCYGAIRWFCSEGRAHLPPNADLSRCFLMGDSAGGNIVHHVGCRIASSDEDIRPIRIVGHVLIQPYFGGEERTPSELRLVNAPVVSVENSDWHWRVFLPEGANRDHPAANVFGPNAAPLSAVPLPPSLVVVGGLDILQDWQLRYVDNLKKLNKDVSLLFYKENIHGFHIFYQYDPSSKFISDLDAFIKKCAR